MHGGTALPVEVRLAVLDTTGDELILALVKDISECKRAEMALQGS